MNRINFYLNKSYLIQHKFLFIITVIQYIIINYIKYYNFYIIYIILLKTQLITIFLKIPNFKIVQLVTL